MTTPIDFSEARAMLRDRKVSDALAILCGKTGERPTDPSLKRGDKIYVHETAKDHVIWYFTDAGKPVVFANGRKRVLEPQQYSRVML